MKTTEFTPAVRIAAYIRVSTEEQAVHGLSIGAQRDALEAWAAQNQVRIVDCYIDAGISAGASAAAGGRSRREDRSDRLYQAGPLVP